MLLSWHLAAMLWKVLLSDEWSARGMGLRAAGRRHEMTASQASGFGAVRESVGFWSRLEEACLSFLWMQAPSWTAS